MAVADVIVVGSGPTGAMAAQTLVEAGRHVIMLDVGRQETMYESTIPETDFLTLRRTDPNQHAYFLGNNLEGVDWGEIGKGAQVTPPRQHMIQTDDLLSVQSDNFFPMESLGYGGLGIGWGIGCWQWSDMELRAAGLDPRRMETAYSTVSQRIGISATADDAANYTLGTLTNYQPSPDMDRNHQRLYTNYQAKQAALNAQGFIMGRTPLALLTQPKDRRRAYSYKDMDFYSDREQSAYRPWITINALRSKPNFTYVSRQLVLRFTEEAEQVTVYCRNTETGAEEHFRAKTLMLASGILGTARIVLRSAGEPGVRLPLLCNPYSYIPCLQPATMGQEAERHKLGFAQLSFFLDEQGRNFDVSMGSLYSYQSLMLFRMARQVPLGFRDTRLLLRYLTSGLIILGIHQPDAPGPNKYLELVPDNKSQTGDALRAVYIPTPQEQSERLRREKKYIHALRKLGVYGLKRIDPGFGSSIHYAGTLPFSVGHKSLALTPEGRLHGTRQVFVADGSGFTYLPAKGLTFSLMANAHNVAKGALKA